MYSQQRLQPNPVVIQTVTSSTVSQAPVGERYKRHFKCVGWIQIILGSLSILLGITNIIVSTVDYTYLRYTYIGCGIWVGVVILVCGILGLRATADKSKCSVTEGMVMTTVSALLTSAMFAIEIIGALNSYGLCYSHSSWGNNYWRTCIKVGPQAIHSILATISFISLVVAITHSGFTCSIVCCRKQPAQGNNTVAYTTQACIQQPSMNSPGVVQNHPNPQFVQQQYQVNPSFPNQPQVVYCQQPTTSVNPFPYQAQPQMAVPPSYESTSPQAQNKQSV